MNNVYLKQCRMIDCQSFKDITYDFSPNLNVFTARNNTGKSIFFKFLKIAGSPSYYNKKKREKLIRRGAKYAQVIYLFSDDSIARMVVASNLVIYYYAPDVNNLEWSMQYNKQFQVVLDKLDLIVDTGDNSAGDTFISNILDLDQKLFFINSDKRSNSRILDLITNNEDMENAIKRCKEKEDIYKIKLSNSSYLKGRLEEELSMLKFIDCEDLKRKIDNSEELIPAFESICCIGDELEKFKPINEKEVDYVSLDKILTLVNNLSKLDFDSAVLKIKDYNAIDDLHNVLCFIDNIGILLCNINIVKSKNYDSLLDMCDSLSIIDNIRKEIDVMCIKSIDIDKTIDKINLVDSIILLQNLYNKFNSLNVINSNIIESDNKLSELNKLLLRFGKLVECPMKGKVVYTDEKCVPYSK